MNVLGNKTPGLLFIISAPAGTGKTTLVRMLTQEFSCVAENVSYTTRAPRPQEKNMRDYHFITDSAFVEKIANQEFLEYASVFGSYYGTSKRDVETLQKQGKHVVLVIDTQGALQLKQTDLQAIYIFILPPSFSELQKRLRERESDTQEAIETRLSWAQKEMEIAKLYDYQIVNENLPIAYDVLRSIFIAEDHKNR